MKKSLIVLSLASLFAAYVTAQNAPANKPKEKASTTQVKEEKKEAKADTAKKAETKKKEESKKKAEVKK